MAMGVFISPTLEMGLPITAGSCTPVRNSVMPMTTAIMAGVTRFFHISRMRTFSPPPLMRITPWVHTSTLNTVV